jgi:hypothetical protein
LCEDWRKKGGKGKIINKREKKERKKKVGFWIFLGVGPKGKCNVTVVGVMKE